MERIHRHTHLESAAMARLLSAMAASLLLHATLLWLAPGPVYSDAVDVLRGRIELPRAGPTANSSLFLAENEAKLRLAENRGIRNSGFEFPEVIDSTYYPVDELDVFPALRTSILIADTVSPKQLVRVLARIDASGRVNDTRIFDATTGGPESVAAMNAILRTPFVPARRNGRNVRSEIVIELAARQQALN